MEVHFLEAKGLIHGLATMRAAFPTADRILRDAVAVFGDLVKS
jgi:acetyl esterase